jgi:prevent-host-death family protein
MKTMAISQFKAHALRIISQIAQDHEPMIITKRGKPLARILPYEETPSLPQPGRLADTLVFEEDIVSPLGEDMWEACS